MVTFVQMLNNRLKSWNSAFEKLSLFALRWPLTNQDGLSSISLSNIEIEIQLLTRPGLEVQVLAFSEKIQSI